MPRRRGGKYRRLFLLNATQGALNRTGAGRGCLLRTTRGNATRRSEHSERDAPVGREGPASKWGAPGHSRARHITSCCAKASDNERVSKHDT